MRLLGYRERSTHELARRLTDDGFPDQVARDVVASLEHRGLVDDARYAEQLVRTRAAAGYGSRRLLQELLDNGIERGEAEALLRESLSPSSEAERLRALVRARPPTDRRTRESLLRRLVAKGFPPGAVLDALNEVGELPEETSGWPDT